MDIDTTLLVAAIGFGLVAGSILSIATVGFTLQFSVTGVFNLAYASVMAVSMFIALWFTNLGLNVWLTLPIAGLAAAVISVALNLGIVEPLMKRGITATGMIIATLAVSLVLVNILLAIVRPGFSTFGRTDPTVYRFLGQIITSTQLEIMALSVGLMILIRLLLVRTKLGKAMRAVASNNDLARSCGINSRLIINTTWALSGFLCGIAAVVLGMSVSVFSTTTAQSFLVIILAAAVLGGIGNPYGAMIGALVLGVTSEILAVIFAPQWKDVLALVVLIGVLLLRPQGIISQFSLEAK